MHATFFLANENTYRGDRALDDGWRYRRARVGEGHVFGNHGHAPRPLSSAGFNSASGCEQGQTGIATAAIMGVQQPPDTNPHDAAMRDQGYSGIP